jgi:hypothetical protein
MKWANRLAALLLVMVAATAPLLAQFEFHGHVYPLARISFEQKYLSLPHRVVSIEGHQRGKNVSLFFNTTLEYRLAENSAVVELQEFYAEYSTGLGDFRFGQHVLAWGATDGNNPTDNVNAYDFYYLFMGGGDRKQGNLMASTNLYLGDLNLEAVITPVFQPNRLPLDEPDFPIFEAEDLPFDPGTVPEKRPARQLENTEFGVRFRLPLNLMDLSVSYFRGFDRMYTPAVSVQLGLPPTITVDSLVYHPTQVLGGDLVTFLGDWAIRAEGAYFLTEDNDGKDHLIRNPYFQSVLQVDRADDNSNFVIQYLGTYITQLDGDDAVDPETGESISEEENERDNLPARMGMPFAAIAQNAVMAIASYDFADGRYSLQGQTLYEFDHSGYMLGGKLTIALEDAFDLELGVTHMGGDKDSRLSSIGDVFSHLYVAMKYSF